MYYCPGCIKDPYSFTGKDEKFNTIAEWYTHYYLKHWKTMPKAWGFTNIQRREVEWP